MAEVIERHEREERAPVPGQAYKVEADDDVDLAPDPARLVRKFFLDALVDFADVVAEITVERIRPGIFRFAVLAVAPDREWIDGRAVRADAVHVADVMA